jgi:hypothetical protein
MVKKELTSSEIGRSGGRRKEGRCIIERRRISGLWIFWEGRSEISKGYQIFDWIPNNVTESWELVGWRIIRTSGLHCWGLGWAWK